MDRDYRYKTKQRYSHCKDWGRAFEKDLVSRLRQISLTSTLCDAKYWRNGEHQCCRSFSAGKSLLRTEICRGSTCNTSSVFPKLCDSRYNGLARDLPCVHLCIIGEKMTLHKRNRDQNSFFIRAKNYSRCLKERNYAMHQQYRPVNKATNRQSNEIRCHKDTWRYKLPYFHVPQIGNILPALSQSSSDSTNSIEDHRYVLYQRRSTMHEDPAMSVFLPKELAIELDRSVLTEQRQSITVGEDSGCASHLSFSSVDLTTICKTPDCGSRTPSPPVVKGLYPAACPAYPMIQSFPACVIPEPDV